MEQIYDFYVIGKKAHQNLAAMKAGRKLLNEIKSSCKSSKEI